MANSGFLLEGEAAITFAHSIIALAPCFNRYSDSYLDMYSGDFIIYDAIDTASIARIRMIGPPKLKMNGATIIREALTKTEWSTKVITTESLRTLKNISKYVKRVVCYENGVLLFDDGRWEVRADFPEARMVDILYAMKLQEKITLLQRSASRIIGPKSFIHQYREMFESREPVRICINDQCSWIEQTGDSRIPSVRFDLMPKQLIPIPDVELASITAYEIDREREVFNIVIRRRNRWLDVLQTLNVYHYYKGKHT